MFCENCGAKIHENSSFCEECGHKVSYLENQTKINEENFNKKKELSSTSLRGPVPPAMRPTPPRKPSEHTEEETKPRNPLSLM